MALELQQSDLYNIGNILAQVNLYATRGLAQSRAGMFLRARLFGCDLTA
jgi:hypothetical protein